MGRLRSGVLRAVAAVILIWGITGCGGHPPGGPSPFVARVTLSPTGSASLPIGSAIQLTASAQNASGANLSEAFTFSSTDTSVFTVSPTGVGCAGIWSVSFTICTPGGTGVVQITASTQGVTSAPTYVFVHPSIDNITVKGILLDSQPIQEPCLSQGQTMTVEARAFSQGTDITASVGPFTWSANNTSVATITPLVNSAYNFATNQATAKATTPGITQIYATASGVSSTTFLQPQPYQGVGLNFFETCPIQNITLELGHVGSGLTSFATSKGSSETVFATVTDVMGNSSLLNPGNGIQLSKIPLTWSATQPGSVSLGAACQLSCTVSTPAPGSGSVTATCAPPTCNIGFPEIPSGVSAPFIPLPVYATTAVSGVVTGGSTNSGSVSIIATSLGCALEPPATCATGIYSFSSAKAVTGTATSMPTPPNSFQFDLAGDKVYMGSNFGAQVINPANFGSTTNPFTPLGTITGRVIAVSLNGSSAIFSDTVHNPNQVYIVNSSNPTSPTTTALNIAGASMAAFSPDGLKAFIFGFDTNGEPNLYVYSALTALQIIPLPPQTSVNSIVFSTNGAFAYVVEPSIGGGGPAFSVYNTCDNQPYTDTFTGKHSVPLAAPPIAFKALPDGVHFVALENDGNLESFTASVTGIPPATLTKPATSLCSMTVGHDPSKIQAINLGQGSIQPLNFFVSADGSLLYIPVFNLNSILVYNFGTGAVSGIQLKGPTNPTPITADISVDGSTMMIAASDGLLHEVTTGFGGSDTVQVSFPNLANYQNSFCTVTPASGPCILDFVAAKP